MFYRSLLLLLLCWTGPVFTQLEDLPARAPKADQQQANQQDQPKEQEATKNEELLSFQNLTTILVEIKANPNTLKAMRDISVLEKEYKGELFFVGQTVEIKGVRYSKKEDLKVWVKSLEGIESELTVPSAIASAFDNVGEYDYIEVKAKLSHLSSDQIALTVTEYITQRPFDPKAELINYNKIIAQLGDPNFLYPRDQQKTIQGLKVPGKLFRSSPLSALQSKYYMELGALRGTFKSIDLMEDHISMTMEVEGEPVIIEFPFKERPYLELAKAGTTITVIARAVKFDPVKGSRFKHGAYFFPE